MLKSLYLMFGDRSHHVVSSWTAPASCAVVSSLRAEPGSSCGTVMAAAPPSDERNSARRLTRDRVCLGSPSVLISSVECERPKARGQPPGEAPRPPSPDRAVSPSMGRFLKFTRIHEITRHQTANDKGCLASKNVRAKRSAGDGSARATC